MITRGIPLVTLANAPFKPLLTEVRDYEKSPLARLGNIEKWLVRNENHPSSHSSPCEPLWYAADELAPVMFKDPEKLPDLSQMMQKSTVTHECQRCEKKDRKERTLLADQLTREQ